MKTLKTIQTISKIGKILSKIVFILSLIGGIGCLVGILSLAVIPGGFKIGGTTVYGLIRQSADMDISTMYCAMAIGAVFCAGEAVLSKFAELYFKHELDAGTPFTEAGAKELLRLGILAICIPVGTTVIASIVYAIFSLAGSMPDIDLDNGMSVGLGIAFIIMSLLCRYGAEMQDKPEDAQ